MNQEKGQLIGVGVGPGDPELLTLAAVRAIESADVIAYHGARPGSSIARRIAADFFPQNVVEVEFVYPVTTGKTEHPGGYRAALTDFYEECAATLRQHLDSGRRVVIISEGDPSTYSSYQHHHRRLCSSYPTRVIPGITSYSAAAAALGEPLVEDNQVLSVIPATLPNAELLQHLDRTDAAVVMKLSRNAAAVRQTLTDVNKLDRAGYVERVGHRDQHMARFADVDPDDVPYMSLVVCPGPVPTYYGHTEPSPQTARHEDTSPGSIEASEIHQECGQIVVLGLGPGPDEWTTPAVSNLLGDVTDVIGYTPYVNRVPARSGLTKHASPNRVEAERVLHAVELAQQGKYVAVVSGGDPGVFAMATAVLEEVDRAGVSGIKVSVEPGVTAATAAAARLGAPLGHDFALISLSDQLKPWSIVEARLRAACESDLALGLYNPASSTRREAINATAELLREVHQPDVPIGLARNVGRSGESLHVTTVGDFDPDVVDMSTLVIVGTSTTKVFHNAGKTYLYTPRSYPK